jgi:hypothetical protein
MNPANVADQSEQHSQDAPCLRRATDESNPDRKDVDDIISACFVHFQMKYSNIYQDGCIQWIVKHDGLMVSRVSAQFDVHFRGLGARHQNATCLASGLASRLAEGVQ